MRYQRTTDAASEPISVTEAKDHLKVDASDQDTYIGTLITAARTYCENYCERSFISQTWVAYLENFSWDIELERGEVISVTTVEYYNDSDVLTTVSSTLYNVSGRIIRPIDSWPSVNTDWPEAVVITFITGYGATEADVPEAINQAIKIMIGSWFENRQEVMVGTVPRAVPFAAHALLDQYKLR